MSFECQRTFSKPIVQQRQRGPVCVSVCVCVCSVMSNPWPVALQAPLFMGFSRPEHWSGLPFPPPVDIPDLGIEPTSLASPGLAGRFFTTVQTGKP